MSEEYNQLKALFINNPSQAIIKSQKIITSLTNFKTYQEFYSYHLNNPHISACQREWSTTQMSIKCRNCQTSPSSCICLQCFLNGNHKDHDYSINPYSHGNCDCGDLTAWKHTGCCKNHQGINVEDHPENYLDENLRNTLTDTVFKAAFASFPRLQSKTKQYVQPIFQFISSFLKLGDGFRRLIAISLTERIKFEILLSQVFEYKLFFNQLFQQLCGGLISDHLFIVNFSMANYSLAIKRTIPDIFSRFQTQASNENYSMWSKFWFHSYQPQPIKSAIERYNWDWVSFTLKFSTYMKNFFIFRSVNDSPDLNSIITDSDLYEICCNMKYASNVQPNEQTQLFFDLLFTEVLNCGTDNKIDNKNNDTVISASFYEMHDGPLYYYSCYIFNEFFYKILDCFNNKPNLRIDKLIEELEKSIDISPIFCIGYNSNGNENDLFVSNYVCRVENVESIEIDKDSLFKVSIEEHFKSFHNGGAFFFTIPLFDSLVYLFKNDDLFRMKLACHLMLTKYKKLRIHLGIIAMKRLIALQCCQQSLVSQKNYTLLGVLMPMVNVPDQVYNGIPLIFPLVQLLIGLVGEDDQKLNDFSLKEFFAFEMAREIGIFDDFKDKAYKDENTNEKFQQMLSSFLFMSILFNVERTLFNFDSYKFMEEQIVFALNQGSSSFEDLNRKCIARFVPDRKGDFFLNEIISTVAKISINNKSKNVDSNNNVYISLKEDISCKSISAIIPFIEQQVKLNKEISKNKNTLIKLPEFEDESEYFFHSSNKNNETTTEEANNNDNEIDIKLKEFLSTPSVLAITYFTLRKSSEKVELNDHFALNILLLVFKFSEECSSSEVLDQSIEINYDGTVYDLVKQFKKNLFDFHVDEKGNASITNIMNKKNFKTFLNMKIKCKNSNPKSFVDILLSKGQIGQNVLRLLSIDIGVEDDQQEKSSTKEMKKQRANKLKESIINQYKNKIIDYMKDIDSFGDTKDIIVNNDTNEDVCSICSSSNEEQILSFPLYIYRTKLPFIVDKPPLVAIHEDSEAAVDEDAMNDSPDFKKMIFGQQKQKVDEQPQKTGNLVEKRCTQGNNCVIQFSLCQHPIHQSCIKQRSFNCPIDRSEKNGLLPSIDGLQQDKIRQIGDVVCSNTISKPIKDSISGFINNFTRFINNKNKDESDILIELIKSISGLIVTYEIRLRSLPDCLDSLKNKILSRNLFLTTWYWYRMVNKPNVGNKSKRLTLIQLFILKLIQSDEIECVDNKKKFDEFERILSSFLNSKNDESFFIEKDEVRKNKEIFLFLRRVCLINHFMLNNEIVDEKQTKFIDWDEILSVSNLSQKFKVSLPKLEDEFEFKPISFAMFPKEFLSFGGSPYNFPIEKTQVMSVYNILDYNNLIKNYDDFDPDKNYDVMIDGLKNEVRTTEKPAFNLVKDLSNSNYPTVLLLIGKDASGILVIDKTKPILLMPFYLDKFGCPDIGFRRYQPLFFNDIKYRRIMDLVLSGDFSFYIVPNQQ